MVNPNQIEQTPHLSSISEAIEMRGLDQTDQEEQPSESAIIRFRRALNPFNWDRRKVCSMLQGACFGVFLGSMYLCYIQPLVFCEEKPAFSEVTFNATRFNETIAERVGAANAVLESFDLLPNKLEDFNSSKKCLESLVSYSSSRQTLDNTLYHKVIRTSATSCNSVEQVNSEAKQLNSSLFDVFDSCEKFKDEVRQNLTNTILGSSSFIFKIK